MDTVKLRIPRALPCLWDDHADGYLSPEFATAGQWRAAKRSSRKAELKGAVTPGTYARAVRQVVKVADALRIPDDVVLLPRLQSLAAPNVRSLRTREPVTANLEDDL